MLFTQKLVLLAAATAVSAAPLEARSTKITLPLKHVHNVSNVKNIYHKGLNKLEVINAASILDGLGGLLGLGGSSTSSGSSSSSSPTVLSGTVTNEDVTYVAPINIGGKVQNLIVDTGSSNTWCGAQTSCEPTGSGQNTFGLVQVTYGSGSFTGFEYIDKVSFGGLTVNKQSIGGAFQATGFPAGVDGIIGFGPVDLTAGTVSGQSSVPTFMDNLYAQKSIPSEVLGVYFAPESGSNSNDANGELTLGGTDSSKYSGSISYFPTLTTGAAAPYWGLAVDSFKYGSTSLGAGNAQSIIDTGTTLIYIPQDAYNAFLSASGGSADASGLTSFTTAPTQNFSITFGGKAFTLTPSQYLVPQAQYGNFGLASGKYYSWITSGGASGVNCIVGQKFLENYYSVFDTTAARIGFAPRK